MLILAGVSINAIVGDNGIITNAQNANVKSGIASLEEFIQQAYVVKYGDSATDSPITNFFSDPIYSNWFQKSKKGEYGFVDATSGTRYFFINKQNLPKEIRKGLVGGDSVISDKYWAQFDDIYGVTTKLKVYYCSNGKSSWLGATDELLETNLNEGVSGMKYGSDWATLLGTDGDVTIRDTMSKENLNIADSSLDLSLMYNFPNLKTITFSNITRDDLSGLDGAEQLEEIYFVNCNIGSLSGIEHATKIKFIDSAIGSYQALSVLTNLNKLYLVRPVGKNDEIANLCSADKGIKNAKLKNLKYFGIVGDDSYINLDCEGRVGLGTNISAYSSNNGFYFATDARYDITDVSCLGQLDSDTRDAIEYMNLQNLNIYSIEFLSGYKSLIMLRVEFNALQNLHGIENASKLAYIIARDQYEIVNGQRVYVLGSMESSIEKSYNDALKNIYFNAETHKNTKLYYLDVLNSSIQFHFLLCMA